MGADNADMLGGTAQMLGRPAGAAGALVVAGADAKAEHMANNGPICSITVALKSRRNYITSSTLALRRPSIRPFKGSSSCRTQVKVNRAESPPTRGTQTEFG